VIAYGQEFSTLSDDAKIYKANGPLLLQQTLAEASDLVDKRLAFIRAEIERTEGKLKDLEGKAQKVRSEVLTLSNEPVKQKA
jgi:chaperonin cofactor prefoldin